MKMDKIKDGYDIVKDLTKNISKRKKIKRLIDNMMLAIETNTAEEDFYYNYQILIDLSKDFKWKEKNNEYKKKYIEIKKYYQKNWGAGAILI